jgi:hypothetical protein
LGHDDAGEEEHNLKTAFSLLATTHFRSLTGLCIFGAAAEELLNCRYFEPLLQISGMERFEFRNNCCGLTDELVQKMASAWPKLERFCLESLHEVHPPTLAAIQTFARHCPKLRRLSLKLDPKVPSLEDSDPRTLHRLDQLTTFSFTNNAVIGKANIAAVARHISASFPALLFAFVRLGGDWDTESEDDWAAVCRALFPNRTPEEVSRLKHIVQLEQNYL